MFVYKRKRAHKRTTTNNPIKKLRFAVSPEQNEDVYICRGNGSEGTEGAFRNLKLGSQPEPLAIKAAIKDGDDVAKYAEMDASDNTSEDSPDVLEEGITTLEDFKIVMDGVVIDSLLDANIRTKYFNLCINQNDFLHMNLYMKGNNMLCVGIILEIVNISDAARAANLNTPLVNLKKWDDILKALEGVGMAVGFIREHILKLIALHSEQVEMEMAEKAKIEKERKHLRAKIVKGKHEKYRIDKEMKGLRLKAEVKFREKKNAAW